MSERTNGRDTDESGTDESKSAQGPAQGDGNVGKGRAGKPVGDGEGGADTSGPGNILAGVQPETPGDDTGEERRED